MKRARGGVDLWVVVVGAVALVTYAVHGIHGGLTRDLGLYAYAGQQFAQGVPPYVGVQNRAGPLAHAIPGIGASVSRLAGLDDLLTMRVVGMLVAVACVCAVYVVARDLFGSRMTALVSAATMLSFHGFIEYASNGPREKTPMTLFVVGVLWATTRRRWFTAGVFVSLATLCLQIAFFPTVTAALVGAVSMTEGARRRLHAVVRVLAGGATPALLYLAYAAVVGAVPQTINGFLLLNLRYTPADPVAERLDQAWQDLLVAYGASVWLLLLGLTALLVLAAAAVVGSLRRSHPWMRVVPALAAGSVAGLAWTWHEYDAWPDLFPYLPLAALGVAALFQLSSEHLPVGGRQLVTVGLCGAMLATALDYSITTRSDELRVQQRSVDAVLGELPDDTSVLSVEAPQPLVLSRRTNPTRDQMFSNGLWRYVDDTWPGGLAGYRLWIITRGPPIVALNSDATQPWRDLLAQRYELVGSAPGWWWYARRALGEQQLNRLRAAAASAAP